MVAEERETEKKGERFLGVNPSNRTERDDGARHAARTGAMCPTRGHGASIVKPQSDEKSDTSVRSNNTIIIVSCERGTKRYTIDRKVMSSAVSRLPNAQPDWPRGCQLGARHCWTARGATPTAVS